MAKIEGFRCDNNCEAEKADCQLQGGIWVDSVGYGECDGYCKMECDTTELHQAKVQCEQDGGVPDFELNTITCEVEGTCKECEQNDTSWTDLTECRYNPLTGMYYVEKTTYTLTDCQLSSSSTRYTAPQCEDKDSTYRCLGTVDGRNVMMQAPNGATFTCAADGSCDAAMRQIASGQCKPPPPPPSSSSEVGSSSSGESSSSEESSSSDGGSSSNEGGSSGSGSNDWEGWMKDSLGAIHGTLDDIYFFNSKTYDGVMELNGTVHDINQNTRDLIDKGAEISDKMDVANGYLQTIAGKNFSPEINVGSPDVTVNIDTDGLQAAQNETTDTLHHTNEILDGLGGKLDDIKGLLGSSGSDTIHVDTSKAPASIDSALKFWGNRNNRSLSAAGLDTTGWDAIGQDVVSFGDSVFSNFSGMNGVNGCDTTGGHRCDGNVIGSNGLDSARNSARRVYAELRDSLMHGQFADSLNEWGSKFTAGGTLTGGGSNNCPSFLSRTHTITIGVSSVDMRLDGILCASLFGSVTPWTLARLLIRSIVAFFCMFYLFKCATGFGGGGDD